MTLNAAFAVLYGLGMVALRHHGDHICQDDRPHSLADCRLPESLHWTPEDVEECRTSDDVWRVMGEKLSRYRPEEGRVS